ncbi:protein kinase, cGMP-dependent at 21D isoform 2-T3 [Cochliomyia hominivorax]
MAMKSAVAATETLISTVTGLMEESRQFKEIVENPKQSKDYGPEIKPKMPLSRSSNQLQVPKIMKMNNEAKLLQDTSRQQPKLGISKSQDDEDLKEQQYGSISPISFNKTTSSSSRTGISTLGASRAINFRMKFRKSHTCGSLFAKCNCGSTTSTELETSHLAGSRAASIDQTPPAAAVIATSSLTSSSPATTTTTTQALIHNQQTQTIYYQQQQQPQQQQSLHLSMSPTSQTELSLASSLSETTGKLTASSGFHSLSTQTSSATSAYLSREESLTASFDTHLLSPTTDTPTNTIITTTEALKPFAKLANANNDQLGKTDISQETELNNLTSQRTLKTQQIPRISSPPHLEPVNIPKSLARSSSPVPSARRSEVLHKTSTKKLFQSYSHPDTDFIFTDENKHPSRESLSLLQAPQFQNQETVITARGGKVEIKTPKRSSSPNIGQYQILDVAVHPDILVKISPKHSPLSENRQQQKLHTPLTARSTAQRRRLLQRSHEIDSGGSTSESEKSVDIKSSAEAGVTYPLLPKTISSSPLLSSKLLPGQTSTNDEANFDAAQKYFAESGILGPIHGQSNLIRKTSKALQDANVIEQIRKTSMILRTNTQASNIASMRDNNTTSNNVSGLTSPTKSGLAAQNTLNLKLQNMATTTATAAAAAATANSQQQQPTLLYSPPSPQSPHTMATKCGFSPNVTTQSCIVVDDKDAQIKSLQGEIVSLKDVIKSRDAEIVKLRREIHKLKSVLQQTTNHIPLARDELLQPPSPTVSNAPNRFLMPLQCNDISSTQEKLCEKCKKLLENRIPSIPEQSGSELRVTPDSNGSSIDSSISDPYQSCHSRSASTGNTSETWVPGDRDEAKEAQKAEATEAQNGAVKPKAINPNIHPVLKKQGVSGESCEISMQQSINIPIPKYDKDYSSKQLIKEAIMDNDFLKNIDASQVRELVDSMYSLSIEKGKFVIREGEVGAHLYVSAEGEFEVEKNGKVLGVMGPGKAFGELAILYNCTRTASVKVLTDARVWVLDRRIFQQIMMRTGMQRIENSVNFLKSVPLLKNLSEEVLAKIADVLEVEFYPAGTYIIRQGASGDTFFLISQGSVKVTQKLTPSSEEKEIRTLQMGDYFGEQALINEDKRTANIIAMAPGVECLTLDRESFTHLIGDLCELKEKNYGDENRVLAMKYSEKTKEIFGANVKQEFPDLQLTDLEVVATLGIGGFGRVELVKAYQKNSVDIFALKCLKKRHIVDTKQEEHVFSERTIMLSCNSPFICRLYRTFRDEKYVYMLLEACMGGEIWTMLRDRGCFDDNAAQFIIGCVLQAFEYLHARGIIYRDLKPENLMLDERGYVKLVDFGFAKYIGNSSKTWTFCGTPEYVAPEIILNKGHDRAVDYWALGILIHELLNGTPPFTANDPMKTYNIILKGIDMIDFPKHMSRSAVQLIKKLCRDVPAERLGYQKGGIQDIKKHKWFLGFDWDGLESQLLIPPFVRPIAHATDTCYFDRFPCDPNEPPDELSGWDAGF